MHLTMSAVYSQSREGLVSEAVGEAGDVEEQVLRKVSRCRGKTESYPQSVVQDMRAAVKALKTLKNW